MTDLMGVAIFVNFYCSVNVARGEFTYNGIKDFSGILFINMRDELIDLNF